MANSKFLTRILGSTLAVAALAPVAQATTLKSLECTAYNAYGVARLTLNPETNIVTSVVNFGQLVLDYRVAGVEAKNERVAGYAASGAGIELKNAALTDSAGTFKLLFAKDLLVGEKQYVSGQFIHYTREDRKTDEKPEAAPADIVTPISFVNCHIELGN